MSQFNIIIYIELALKWGLEQYLLLTFQDFINFLSVLYNDPVKFNIKYQGSKKILKIKDVFCYN